MVDYREILRLNSLGNSQRQIEETVHSGHHTVSDTLAAAREKGIAWPLDESMTNVSDQYTTPRIGISSMG